MNVLPLPHGYMDKNAFLAWAEGREGRCELVGGRVVMMVGAPRAHRIITANLVRLLQTHLDPKRWTVLADFGVDLGPDTLRYRDVLVEAAGGDPKGFTTASPVFIGEVLSPSCIATDLRDKAAEYLRLESLTAYLVLAQDEPKAWLWVRGPQGFPPGPEVIEGTDAAVRVTILGLDVPLPGIYAGIATG